MTIRRRMQLIAYLLVCFAACMKAGPRVSRKEANELIRLVKELQGQSRYSEMVVPVARVVEAVRQIKGASSPEHAQWLAIQGGVDFALGDYIGAAKRYRSALEVFQGLRKPLKKDQRGLVLDARLQLANALQSSGNPVEALTELKKVLAAESDWSDPTASERALLRLMLGLVEYQLGHRMEAQKWLDEAEGSAAKGKPNDPLVSAVPALRSLLRIEDGKSPDGNACRTLEVLSQVPGMKHGVPKTKLICAIEARTRGDLSTARKLLLDALASQRASLGKDHSDNAPILSELATVERQSMNFDLAEEFLQEQVRVVRTALGSSHLKLADALLEQAALRLLRGDSEGTRRLVEEARRIQTPLLPQDHIDWAQTLHLEGELAELQGDLQTAEGLERRVLVLRRAQYPGGHRAVAASLQDLAKILVVEGDLSKAEPLVYESLSTFRKVLPPGDRELVFALIAAAIFQQAKGNFKETQELLQEALATIPPGLPWSDAAEALARIHIATTYIIEANPAAAQPHFIKAQEKAARVPKNDQIKAEIGRYYGVLLLLRDDYLQAKVVLTEALGLCRQLGPLHPNTIRTALALGVVLRALGDYEGAEGLLRPILEALEQTKRQTMLQATLAASVARILIDQNDDRSAEPLLRSAVQIAEKERGGAYIELAEFLVSLGSIRSRAGDRNEAEKLWSRAEQIVLRESDSGHPIVAIVRSARAQALMNSASGVERGPEAVRLANEAVQRLQERFGPDNSAVADARGVLAMAKWHTGDLVGARSELQLRATAEAAALPRWLALGDEKRYSNLLGRLSPTDLYVSFHLNGLPADRSAAELAFWAVLQRKGTIQDLIAEHARIERQPGDVRTLIADWKQKERTLAACDGSQSPLDLVRGMSPQTRDCFNGIAQRAAEAGAAFRRVLEKAPSVAMAATPVQLAQLASRLREMGGFALVEIVQYRSMRPPDFNGSLRYAAYGLLPDGQVKWADLAEQDRIDEQVKSLRRLLSQAPADPKSPDGDVRQAARELDKLVMAPVRPLLGSVKQLFVAADGDLNLTDFSFLVDEGGRYLIDTYAIAGLTSGRDLLRLTRTRQTARPAREDHLFVDPAFSSTAEALSSTPSIGHTLGADLVCNEAFQKPDWIRVPFATDLEKQWEKALPNLKVHRNKDANKYVLASIQKPRTIWLLTHGFFCTDGAGQHGSRLGSSLWTNPMDRAALVLAGASADNVLARRNGYVTATEISQFSWDGVELVVLGACETALGTPKVGDGILGLRRALVVSGARSQVMTLWEVEGEATKRLLGEISAALGRGEGRLKAVREAQRKIREELPHPYYWAGLSFIGEPGSMQQ